MLTAADISATSSVIDQITTEAINNPQVVNNIIPWDANLLATMKTESVNISRSERSISKLLTTFSKLTLNLFLTVKWLHIHHKGKKYYYNGGGWGNNHFKAHHF